MEGHVTVAELLKSVAGSATMADELPLDLSFTCLADRRRKSRLMYYEIFLWKMRHAPENVNRFCDPSLDAVERKVLIKWIR